MRFALLILALAGAQPTGKYPQPQIYSLHVQSHIRHRYAHTLVTSRVANPTNISQEAVFTVVLPNTAFITGLIIEDHNGVYQAYVKEKEAAKKDYVEAVKRERTGAHVSMSDRDSNRFTVSMNVEPRKKLSFNLTYEELLKRKVGLYKHIINLDPGYPVLDFNLLVSIHESSRITYLQVPPFKHGNEAHEYPSSDEQNPDVRIHRGDPYSAVIRWAPSPEEQQVLTPYGMKGQFVIKYDVDWEFNPQQMLVNDGYFVHFFAPPDLPPLRKHVTFVLDASSSMSGRNLQQLKEAMNKILEDLYPIDFFSLIRFSSKPKVWNSFNAFVKFNKNSPEFNPVVPATGKNIEKAKMIIESLDANGATDINKALKTALQLTRLGKKQWKAGPRVGLRYPEPMIIFLTDGEPTEGKKNTAKIITAITNRNKKSKASIFSLALGGNADFRFLKKLAVRNSGFARKIYESSDTSLQLTNFYSEVASPLLANVTFKYLSNQVHRDSLTQRHFYFFYLGSELVVSGRLQSTTPGEELQYEVKGRSPDGVEHFIGHETTPIRFQLLDDHQPAGLLERLWAYLSIQQLLEQADNKSGKRSTLNSQVLELALKYSFVTPVSSMILVKPDGMKIEAEVMNSNPDEGDVSNYDDGAVYEDYEDRKNYQPPIVPNDYSLAHILPRNPDPALTGLWEEDTPRILKGNARGPTLVEFEDIDWLSAFTVETRILLPFGANSSVEVLGPRFSETLEMQLGEKCSTPEGEQGHCRHLRLCPLSSFRQNFTAFLEYFCILENRFVGSCCPYRLILQIT